MISTFVYDPLNQGCRSSSVVGNHIVQKSIEINLFLKDS